MVETFTRFWPSDVDLLLFTEGFTAPSVPNVHGLEFPQWFSTGRSDMKQSLMRTVVTRSGTEKRNRHMTFGATA
jgi:hypothetical protein